jgi:hypothetical protein
MLTGNYKEKLPVLWKRVAVYRVRIPVRTVLRIKVLIHKRIFLYNSVPVPVWGIDFEKFVISKLKHFAIFMSIGRES